VKISWLWIRFCCSDELQPPILERCKNALAGCICSEKLSACLEYCRGRGSPPPFAPSVFHTPPPPLLSPSEEKGGGVIRGSGGGGATPTSPMCHGSAVGEGRCSTPYHVHVGAFGTAPLRSAPVVAALLPLRALGTINTAALARQKRMTHTCSLLPRSCKEP
jgi:hypothetical protein